MANVTDFVAKNVLTDINRGDIVIIMGDMNAQIGQCNLGLERTIGQLGLEMLTENGEMFTDCINIV